MRAWRARSAEPLRERTTSGAWVTCVCMRLCVYVYVYLCMDAYIDIFVYIYICMQADGGGRVESGGRGVAAAVQSRRL
jgi:hypothetical protein